jgi:site-specific recombinase XerD
MMSFLVNFLSKEDIMFEHYFNSPSRIKSLRDSPHGTLLEGFTKVLCQGSYARITARRYTRAVEHFLCWLKIGCIPISSLSQKYLERFERHIDQCRCPLFGSSDRRSLRSGSRLFFKYLRSVNIIASTGIESTAQDPVLLTEFYHWMRQQRGTSDVTLNRYSHSIRLWLKRHGENPTRFDAQSLRQFVLNRSQQSGLPTAKKCITALRMFIRFLIAEGKCPVGLDAAIPVVAQYRLSTLPRFLQPNEVERVIASCNLNTPKGKRDRAILLLLARLGLRAGDIVKLSLGDINWEGAWVYVSGKGRRQDRFPLTQEVGQAIVDYMQYGRPQTETNALFIRCRAPFCGFSSPAAVSQIVARAMKRAGVICRDRGAAHILRHSVATSMLRQGASLQDIATILRHRSTETTEIYVKVDVDSLREIAQPWPEVPQC